MIRIIKYENDKEKREITIVRIMKLIKITKMIKLLKTTENDKKDKNNEISGVKKNINETIKIIHYLFNDLIIFIINIFKTIFIIFIISTCFY